MKRFYSNGKLFITGEYVVLDGANAFALPTKAGQDLVIEKGIDAAMRWKSLDADGSVWFEDTISFQDIVSRTASGSAVKNTLVGILHQAHKMNPDLLAKAQGFQATTHLTFPREWGLGTSSTLINNIADWFGVNPFELLRNSFGGSGYDIACARHDSAILYNTGTGKPAVTEISFFPGFLPKLYFVYLNQKQSSKSAIASYRQKAFDTTLLVDQINALTEIAIRTNDIAEFKKALEQHEALLGEALQLNPVKETLFPDFDGTIKSLGAWGGDFILAVSESDPSEYFRVKGYPVVIPYKDMIL